MLELLVNKRTFSRICLHCLISQGPGSVLKQWQKTFAVFFPGVVV